MHSIPNHLWQQVMEGGSYLDWTARRRFLWTIGSSLYMATRAGWQGGDDRVNAVQHSALWGELASAAGEASHNDPGVQRCSSFRFRAILYQIRLQFFSSSYIPPLLANDILIYQTKCITWIHLTMCSDCILARGDGFPEQWTCRGCGWRQSHPGQSLYKKQESSDMLPSTSIFPPVESGRRPFVGG